jgi:hypothetical protein
MLSDERLQQEDNMTDDRSMGLVLAERAIPDAVDHVRRYCGLAWSGGPPETWAYRYFDVIDNDPAALEPTDVVCASSLHPGINRADLSFFHDQKVAIDAWLQAVGVDADIRIAEAEDALLGLLDFDAPSFTLLTKVLHRKRPNLVPLVDRHVLDRYRPITGERRPELAWPGLVKAIRSDVELNADALTGISSEIDDALEALPGALRICDIAIWMEARR